MSDPWLKHWYSPDAHLDYFSFRWTCAYGGKTPLSKYFDEDTPVGTQVLKTHHVDVTIAVKSDFMTDEKISALKYIVYKFHQHQDEIGVPCESCEKRVAKILGHQHNIDPSILYYDNAVEAVPSPSLSSLARELPGVMVRTKSPCDGKIPNSQGYADCGVIDTLYPIMDIVIHLNDDHKWTREAIADWLESVHDPENGIDLSFKTGKEES